MMRGKIRLFSLLSLGALMGPVSSFTPCTSDRECPKTTMMCSPSPEGEARRCACRPGWVGWMWDCLPRAALGEDCTSSLQCQLDQGEDGRRVCSPVSHTCSCGPGFVPSPPSASGTGPLCTKLYQERQQGEQIRTYHEDTKVNENAHLEVSDDVIPVFVPLKKLAEPKRIPGGRRAAYIRSAVKAALNNTINNEGMGPEVDGGDIKEIRIYWRKENTLVLVGCLAVCLGLAALLTGLYLRAVQEKRASQAALKSLIRFLSEREGDSPGGGSQSPVEKDPEDVAAREATPTFDYAILGPARHVLPSRLTLVPLEGEGVIRLPAPHSSHAPLPGIPPKKPCRRERQTYQQLDPRDLATGNPAAETLRQMFVDGRAGREEPPRYEDLLN